MRRPTVLVLKAFNRSLGPILPPRLLSRPMPGIPGRVHIDDPMLTSGAPRHRRHYVEDAQSGMRNIEEPLAAVGRRWEDVDACLDFASGYGRVTRFLAARLTPSRVTVADIERPAVRFCRAEFGVAGFLSRTDPYHITIPGTYDLIFVGSLLTHLPREECLCVVDVLFSVLRVRGLLIFSTQGESCLDHLDWYGARFAAAESRFRAGVARDGIYFLPYRRGARYGITIHAADALKRDLSQRLGNGATLVRFAARGWDRHQDVWSYARTG